MDGWLSLSGGRLGGSPGRSGIGGAAQGIPDGHFSFIFETGQHEMDARGLPESSEWAAHLGCGVRVRRADVVDAKAGYVYDGSRQNAGSDGWRHLPRPGTAEVFQYQKCKDGRMVVDVVRESKGHTEGLEPQVTGQLVKLMLSAKK